MPFRKSVHLSYKDAVKRYISDKYDQHPDMFRDDIDRIDAQRRDAVNVREPHASGIVKLQAYAAQLTYLGAKFPTDIGCDFTWYPALGYNIDRPIVQNNHEFELANILFNMAALYSQLAVSSNRNNSEGLKLAANYFMLGAGILTHIKEKITPEMRMDPPEDMGDHTLSFLNLLFLAQAQECFWQKACSDGMKDVIISKLAAQVSDFYGDAAEVAVLSNAVTNDWIRHMNAKQHHFAAAAQYRASLDCLEKRKYGEEVARLTDAVLCAKDGLKECKSGKITQRVVDDLVSLRQRAEEDLRRAEKDNDIIYLHIVPAKSELRLLDRAKMAMAKCPPEVSNPLEYLGDRSPFGPAIFSRLVPFAVHLAVSIYEERRNHLVNVTIADRLDALMERLTAECSELNVPASYQAFERPLGIPPTLLQQAEEIRQSKALEAIPRTFADVKKLRAVCLAGYEEVAEIVCTEEQEDDRLRAKYGTDRWTRPESRMEQTGKVMWVQIDQFQDYVNQGAEADQKVQEKFENVRSQLALLSGPQQYLLDSLPLSRQNTVPEKLKPSLSRLRATYNDVLRAQSLRRRRIEAAKRKMDSDDVKADVLKEAARIERAYPSTPLAPEHFDSLFEERLSAFYEEDEDFLAKQEEEQDHLVEAIKAGAKDFDVQMRALGGADALGGKERQNALRELHKAYDIYRDIKRNTEAGVAFYNGLTVMIANLKPKLIDWVEARTMEARAMEE